MKTLSKLYSIKMKKYILLSAVSLLSLGAISSCSNSTTDPGGYTDNDTYPQMKDITASFSSANSYAIYQSITIPSTDVVLVYRNVNSNTSGTTPVWQLLPKTEYLNNNRELDYNFVFNTQQVQVTTSANFEQNTMTTAEKNTYLNNQTFRIVLVPASSAKSAQVNFKDYNSVVRFYNLKETQK